MPEIRHKQTQPFPDATYSELFIPDDGYLGTGVFEIELRRSAFDTMSFSILEAKRPDFSLEIRADPAEGVLRVHLGHEKSGSYELTSRQVYRLSTTMDADTQILKVPFERWHIGTVSVGGVALRSSVKGHRDDDWVLSNDPSAMGHPPNADKRVPCGGPFPEHEGTVVIAFPEPDLPDPLQQKLLDTFRTDVANFVFVAHHEGNTALEVYRDASKSLIYHHWNPSFGERKIAVPLVDLLDGQLRAILLSFSWSPQQSAVHVKLLRKDGKHEAREGFAFSHDKLLLVEDTLRRFDELLEDAKREEDAHQFLKAHPILLGLTSSINPLSKLKLGGDYVTDFVLREAADGYVFVEIERPTLALFKKGVPPERSAELNHAIEQIESWRAWINNHHTYLLTKLDGLTPDPMCWLVAGRRRNLTADQFTRLAQINATYRGLFRIYTYDDVADRVRNILMRVRGV